MFFDKALKVTKIVSWAEKSLYSDHQYEGLRVVLGVMTDIYL